MRILLTTILPAFVVALCLTPLVRRLAKRLGFVDHPDRHRKLHAQATPLGGGVAVLLAIIVTVLISAAFLPSRRADFTGDMWFLIGGLAAAVIICLIGLLDDRYGLRGRQKLVGQFIAAGIWLSAGLWIDKVHVFGLDIELGMLAVPFTLLWLMGAINALNLMDGADGLGATVGIVLSIAITVMATLTGHQTEAFLALAMAGALAGFLVYNSPPASIFLGDSGSMLIGLVLGGLAIRSSLKDPGTVALAALVAIWAIPILDVIMAIIRRKLTGRSIYTTDHGHLHHIVQQRGFRGWNTVLVVGLLSSLTAGAAVASIYMRSESLAVGAICIVFFTLVVSGFFGQQECLLLAWRAKHFIMSLIPYTGHRECRDGLLNMRLQGTRRWEELWETLTRFAERFDLSSKQYNVTMPAIDEEYHAIWKRKDHPSDTQLFRSEIPLFVREVTVGRLRIVSSCHGDNFCTWIGALIEGLKPFQTHLRELIRETGAEETVITSINSAGSSLCEVRLERSHGRGRILDDYLHKCEEGASKPNLTHNVVFESMAGGEINK